MNVTYAIHFNPDNAEDVEELLKYAQSLVVALETETEETPDPALGELFGHLAEKKKAAAAPVSKELKNARIDAQKTAAQLAEAVNPAAVREILDAIQKGVAVADLTANQIEVFVDAVTNRIAAENAPSNPEKAQAVEKALDANDPLEELLATYGKDGTVDALAEDVTDGDVDLEGI